MDNNRKLSQFISLILRHKPEVANVTLDKNGWADTKELIKGIKNTGRIIDFNILEEIVNTDDKQRYSFNENKTKIRANQGHSILVDIELEEKTPPEYLYHGTAIKSLDSIYKHGVKSMSRNFVHLSKDEQTARKVGNRHGKPAILKINTKAMVDHNNKFYLSANNVWLTEFISPEYIEETIF